VADIIYLSHDYDTCRPGCDNASCMICIGGLSLCKRCGGGEGSLPTNCPGVRMTKEQEDKVYAGELDYRIREGWVPRPSNVWSRTGF
jgi:hypothetical protein